MTARRRRTTVTLTAVTAALALLGAACGNRSSDAQVRALFNGAGNSSQAAGVTPGAAEDVGAAPAGDTGAAGGEAAPVSSAGSATAGGSSPGATGGAAT